ncbi:hypothetical protein [Paraburkholderia sp. J11-2]|uniref:hypothetical protein n=1 Tax=Paraburkholderia sp. J11-2 TaxID=2805431 RepID=UPI002AB5E90A|nr:hypothetical protein [Paraburkholderia sp. J11-2]
MECLATSMYLRYLRFKQYCMAEGDPAPSYDFKDWLECSLGAQDHRYRYENGMLECQKAESA